MSRILVAALSTFLRGRQALRSSLLSALAALFAAARVARKKALE